VGLSIAVLLPRVHHSMSIVDGSLETMFPLKIEGLLSRNRKKLFNI
jgi:hypothetical protein